MVVPYIQFRWVSGRWDVIPRRHFLRLVQLIREGKVDAVALEDITKKEIKIIRAQGYVLVPDVLETSPRQRHIFRIEIERS
jgi:hypothetical protein